MTSPAQQIVDHLAARPATLGGARLVCIDGPSGSGKTTLADEVGALTDATVLHTDQLCPGWDGLPAVPAILGELLSPLSQGRPGSFRVWDWIGDGPGALIEVEPVPLLVIEGVGSGARLLAGWTTTLVWLEADAGVRKTRALERDAYFRGHWDAWTTAELAYFTAEQVADRADLTFRTG